MKRYTTILAASLLTFSMAAPAMAQDQDLPQYMTGDQHMRSSKMIGMAVYNDQNEKIGVLEEILLPAKGGEVTAVISVGSYLGGTEKLIKVPLSTVHFVRKRATMTGDKASIRAMQKYYYGYSGE